jgi:signal transduction histidine kinase
MMASLIGGLCLMFTVISLYGIYFTHRVAGPIFKMRRLLRQLEGGVYPVDARLRKDDELRGFFEDFIHLAASLKDRDARRAATVDSMLAKLATEPQADIKISLELFRSELIGAEAAASTHPAASP